MGKYKKVKITKGPGGWGGPLIIEPKEGKDYIVSVTGGGICSVAKKIAELSGGRAFDGFRSAVPEEQICCVVIDCGGTARIGVYPMKKIPTVDIISSGPSGPLSSFITPELFVSGVTEENIEVLEE